MLSLDLGCGYAKFSGFIGVDRFPLPGVDVIADLNKPLPFRTGSVDLVYASHSLEHVDDLMATMREVYRICRHGAQLCIVAPYNEQKLNLANPYHKCVFNEHTPRFWTHYPAAGVDPEEYFHPNSPLWGLSRSDNSDPGLDLRLVRMEFFHFPAFLGLPDDELRALRKQRVDVCDQIMYHLVAWKSETEMAGDFDRLIAGLSLFEPPYVTARRQADRQSSSQQPLPPAETPHAAAEFTGIQSRSSVGQSPLARSTNMVSMLDQVAGLLADLRETERSLRQQLSDLSNRNDDLAKQRHAADLLRRETEIANQSLSKQLLAQEGDLQRWREEIDRLRGENLTLKGQVVVVNSLISELRTDQEAKKNEIASHQGIISRQVEEIHAERSARSRQEMELSLLQETIQNLKSQIVESRGRLLDERTNQERILEQERSSWLQKCSLLEASLSEKQAQNHTLIEDRQSLQKRIDALMEETGAAGVARGQLASEKLALQDRCLALQMELDIARQEISRLSATLHSAEDGIASFRVELADLGIELPAASQSLAGIAPLIARERETSNALKSELARMEAESRRYLAVKAELEAAKGVNAWYQSRESAWQQETEELRSTANLTTSLARNQESALRGATRIISQIRNRILDMNPLASLVYGRQLKLGGEPSGAFAPLAEFTASALGGASALLPTLSEDLSRIPYREYPMWFSTPGFSHVDLAIDPLVENPQGTIGIEVVSAAGQIVAQVTLPLASVNPSSSTRFLLGEATPALTRNWCLRVFVRDTDTPVFIHEVAKLPLLRTGVVEPRPLLALA